MRPILATIPALPDAALWPLVMLAVLIAVAFSIRAARAPVTAEHKNDAWNPLFLAAFASIAFWVWHLRPIVLHSYGLFLVFGFALSVWLSTKEAVRRGVDPNIIIDLSLPLLAWSVAACRLLYILLNHDQFHSLHQMIAVWDGGLSFHGSLVAAPLVVWFYARRARLTFWQLADIIAPSVFAGYAVGRIGCLMNGCCYGYQCSLPWAMRFPDELNRGVLTPPSHPTQIYSTILGTGLFFLMQRLKVMPAFNRFAGQLTIVFFALYAFERGFIEYFRNGATANTVLGTDWLTQAQVASIIVLVVLAVTYWLLSRRAHHVSTPQLRGG